LDVKIKKGAVETNPRPTTVDENNSEQIFLYIPLNLFNNQS